MPARPRCTAVAPAASSAFLQRPLRLSTGAGPLPTAPGIRVPRPSITRTPLRRPIAVPRRIRTSTLKMVKIGCGLARRRSYLVCISFLAFFKFGVPELAKRISRQKPVKCSFPIRYEAQVRSSDLNPTLTLNLTLNPTLNPTLILTLILNPTLTPYLMETHST